LSGVDEQFTDIPVCPICGKRPLFWSLYPTIDGSDLEGWIWFFSEEYMKDSDLSRLSCEGCFDLDKINSVSCRPSFIGVDKISRHHFKKDSAVFKTVMSAARRLQK